MSGFFKRCDALVGRVSSAVGLVASLICLLMAAHIVLELTMRSLFNSPLPGTVAIVSNYYMVAITFLPLAAAERIGSHISVEILTEQFSLKIQKLLMALIWAMSAMVAVLVAVATWGEAESKRQVGTYVMESGYRLPLWPAQYLLPIGCGLLALTYVFRVVGTITGNSVGGKDPFDDNVEPNTQYTAD